MDAFVPIRRVIPRWICACHGLRKFEDGGVGKNFSCRVRGSAGAGGFSLPVNPDCRAINVFRVVDSPGIPNRGSTLLHGKCVNKWQREARKNNCSQQGPKRSRPQRDSRSSSQYKSAEQKYRSNEKHRRLRKIGKAQQRSQNQENRPTSKSAANAQKQCRGQKRQHRHAQVGSDEGRPEPVLCRPNKEDASPEPRSTLRAINRSDFRRRPSTARQYPFFQK